MKPIAKLKLLSIYDKKMLAIMYAVENLRYYLLGQHFIIKTDHQSLKNLLTQKNLSKQKDKLVSKLQCFDFKID